MKKLFLEKIVFVMLLATICMGFFIFGLFAISYQENFYSMTTVVSHVSKVTDTVTIEDFSGNLWQFKGVEDWKIGDIASCVMDSKGNEEIEDDEIIRVNFSGKIDEWRD